MHHANKRKANCSGSLACSLASRLLVEMGGSRLIVLLRSGVERRGGGRDAEMAALSVVDSLCGVVALFCIVFGKGEGVAGGGDVTVRWQPGFYRRVLEQYLTTDHDEILLSESPPLQTRSGELLCGFMDINSFMGER